jgi:hypothetical protein
VQERISLFWIPDRYVAAVKSFDTREITSMKQEGHCKCKRNIEARSRITVAVEKQYEYYLLVCVYMLARACVRACMWVTGRVGVCMCIRAYNLANPVRNANASYCDVCGPSVSTIFFHIIS